jgi:hypothetical protein
MRKWVAGLTGAAERDETRVAIRCVAYASEGTPVTALVGPGEWAAARLGPDRVAAEFEVCTRGVEPAFDPVLDDLWRDAAGLDFCWIPEPLRGDADFLHRSGLADCASAAPILVDECARRGREARTAFGLLLATPISTPHHWVEVRDRDGRWIPFDPILISLLTRFAGLDGTTWPPSRSPGAILLRLADDATPLVWTEAEPLEASFQARLTTRIAFRRASGARA